MESKSIIIPEEKEKQRYFIASSDLKYFYCNSMLRGKEMALLTVDHRGGFYKDNLFAVNDTLNKYVLSFKDFSQFTLYIDYKKFEGSMKLRKKIIDDLGIAASRSAIQYIPNEEIKAIQYKEAVYSKIKGLANNDINKKFEKLSIDQLKKIDEIISI